MSEKGKNLKNRGLEQFLNNFFTYALKYLIPASSLTLTGCMSTFPDRRVEDPTRTSIPDGPTPQTPSVPEGGAIPRTETQQQENKLAKFEINVGELIKGIQGNSSELVEDLRTFHYPPSQHSSREQWHYYGKFLAKIYGNNGENEVYFEFSLVTYQDPNQDLKVMYFTITVTGVYGALMFIAPSETHKKGDSLGSIFTQGLDEPEDKRRRYNLSFGVLHGVLVLNPDDIAVFLNEKRGNVRDLRMIIGVSQDLKQALEIDRRYSKYAIDKK